MEIWLDFTNICYRSLDSMALSTETLGKASSPRKKNWVRGQASSEAFDTKRLVSRCFSI